MIKNNVQYQESFRANKENEECLAEKEKKEEMWDCHGNQGPLR